MQDGRNVLDGLWKMLDRQMHDGLDCDMDSSWRGRGLGKMIESGGMMVCRRRELKTQGEIENAELQIFLLTTVVNGRCAVAR